MGLAADLGYEHTRHNLLQRVLARVFSTRIGSALVGPFIGTVDRFAFRVTQTHSTLSGFVVGVPVLFVTTVGARTGETHETALYGIPVNGDLALIGSAFGRRATPAWVFNIEANPRVEVVFSDVRLPAIARPATPAEERNIWEGARSIYAGFAKYARRASHRRIRVFVLEAAPETESDKLA